MPDCLYGWDSDRWLAPLYTRYCLGVREIERDRKLRAA